MAIKINGTTVISDSAVVQNVTGFKTINGNSILGSGDLVVGGLTPNTQTFNSSGTWSKPSGSFSRYKVEIWSGGGSGGTGQPGYTPAGGGGGGGYWSFEGPINDLAATETVTVGAGGAFRSGAINLLGNKGGNSSFTFSGSDMTTPYTATVYGGGGGNVGGWTDGGGGGSFYGPGTPGATVGWQYVRGSAGGPDAGVGYNDPTNMGIANVVFKGLVGQPSSGGTYQPKDGYTGGGGGAGPGYSGSANAGSSVYGGAGGYGGPVRAISRFGGNGGVDIVGSKDGLVPGGGGSLGPGAPGTWISGNGAPGRIIVTVY